MAEFTGERVLARRPLAVRADQPAMYRLTIRWPSCQPKGARRAIAAVGSRRSIASRAATRRRTVRAAPVSRKRGLLGER